MGYGKMTENERQVAKTPRRQAECLPVTWAFSLCQSRAHGLKARVILAQPNLFSFLASWRLGAVAFVCVMENAG